MTQVYVLLSEWIDRSGDADVLRVYEFQEDAESDKLLIEAAQPMRNLRIVVSHLRAE